MTEGNRRGFTLLEVLVAIGVSGLVIALAFGAWAAVTRHTSRLDQGRLLDLETRRIAVAMANELRRSSDIVLLKPQAVGYVSAVTFDTVEYRSDGTDLFRRDERVQIRSVHARVCEFTVEDCSRSPAPPAGDHLIRITLCLEDAFGNRSRLSVRAAVHVAEEIVPSME